MSRQRSYDTDDVVRRAMEQFWLRGYASTSMSDLYQATGLKPGSVYAAFGDKERLFQKAFEAYAARFRETLPKDVRGLAAIEAWLAIQADLATDDPERRGCLIVNTVAERHAHTPDTQALAQGRMDEIRAFFRKALDDADADGQLANGTDLDLWADSLTGTVVSLMTLGRARADESIIRHVAQAALLALPRRG